MPISDLNEAARDTSKSCVFDFPDRPVRPIPPVYPPPAGGWPPSGPPPYPYEPWTFWGGPPAPTTPPVVIPPGAIEITGTNFSRIQIHAGHTPLFPPTIHYPRVLWNGVKLYANITNIPVFPTPIESDENDYEGVFLDFWYPPPPEDPPLNTLIYEEIWGGYEDPLPYAHGFSECRIFPIRLTTVPPAQEILVMSFTLTMIPNPDNFGTTIEFTIFKAGPDEQWYYNWNQGMSVPPPSFNVTFYYVPGAIPQLFYTRTLEPREDPPHFP